MSAQEADDPVLKLRVQNRQELDARLARLEASALALAQEVAQVRRELDGLPVSPVHQSEAQLASKRQAAANVPTIYNVTAGAICLPLAFAVAHPLDSVRTRLQTVARREGAWSAWKALRSDGAVLRGAGASVLAAVPQGAIRFGCYGKLQEELRSLGWRNDTFIACCAAVGSDVASSTVKIPREALTQRVQTGEFANSWAALSGILRTEGVAGLFRGSGLTFARDVPFFITLFVSYESFKEWKLRVTLGGSWRTIAAAEAPLSDAETVLWGGISGAMAGAASAPFDVLRTAVVAKGKENRSIDKELFAQLMEGGVRSLFRGGATRAIWWGTVCCVFFSTFERLKVELRTKFEVI